MKKNAALLSGLLLALAGCAQLPMGKREADGERIVELASGREISRAELLQRLRASDFVLLGEQHDNALHHQRRGELLAALGPGAPVVAEHLTRGQAVAPGADLLPRLEAAGFEAKSWRWPLHEPLFAAAAAPGHTLLGGNAPRELARDVARRGKAAVPAELLPPLQAAPLGGDAQKALDEDLVQGHCGMLAGERLQQMRWAQRVRDAAMATTLGEAAARHGKPAVLLAGNGHVRLDYGVPQLLHQAQPAARVVSVGFIDAKADTAAAPYDYVWLTPAPEGRGDPCEGMKAMMAPKS